MFVWVFRLMGQYLKRYNVYNSESISDAAKQNLKISYDIPSAILSDVIWWKQLSKIVYNQNDISLWPSDAIWSQRAVSILL